MKNVFKKDKLGNTKSCHYQSVKECPFNDLSDCSFDKKNCYLKHKNRGKGKWFVKNVTILFFALIGLLLYLLCSIGNNTKSYNFEYSEYVYTIIESICLSVMSGCVLALLIDIPSKLKDYETSFVNALASRSYLKMLDEERLVQLREDVTEQLHKKNVPYMAKGLINIDQRICDLLKKPYYTKYRLTVNCVNDSSNSDFIIKDNFINYRLINPYGENKEATEIISFSSLILLEEKEKEDDYIYERVVSYSKDDDLEFTDISKFFKLTPSKLNQKTEFYNTKVEWDSTDNNNPEIIGYRVDFKDHIEVKVQFKIKVPKDDICFTKRLRHPAKNFRLDYSSADDNVKLYGQLFGTEIKQQDITIQYSSDNSISIETFDWLLPDNGAIVVMTKKEKNND